jgi:transcriptional regulator with XRE-family HTH domain
MINREPSDIDVRLGQRLRASRLAIGMSQERLADLLGVTFQQVQKYEKGVNRIAASRLYDICQALDVPVGHFFEGLNRKSTKPEGAERKLDRALAMPDAIELVLTFASIPTSKIRRRVLELVRAMSRDEQR